MSTTSSTSTTITPLQLTGVSSMSTNLQAILTRAVNIAQVPITQLQNRDSDVLEEKTLLSSLSTSVSALGTAVSKITSLATTGSLSVTSSDSTVVSAEDTGATYSSSHTISNITSIASSASANSASSYADTTKTAVSSTGSMELVFGSGSSDTYSFTLTTNTLTGLRDKINSLDAGVTADILTTDGKNYLTITANDTGAVQDFSLIDDPGDSTHANTQMLTNISKGSDAAFSFDGISITRTTNTVNDLVSGITFNLLEKPDDGTSVTLTTSSDSSQLSTALGSLVTAYNSLYDLNQQQVGSSAGLLSGDYTVRQIQSDLRSLASSSLSSGTVKSLADVGITFDTTGHMSFDSDTFSNLSSTGVEDAMKFFSSTDAGSFSSISSQLTGLTDSVSGVIKLEQNGLDKQDTYLEDQISTLTDRVNSMQTLLSQQLAAADTYIASLESQQTMLDSSIAALNYALYGKVVSGTTGS